MFLNNLELETLTRFALILPETIESFERTGLIKPVLMPAEVKSLFAETLD